ncbi:MAG: NAD-dependent epimerase/dehydratase family protein, partial [Promethearchaeota archaeon]
MIKIKILITGSNGFVGANLVEYILEIFTNIYEAANSEGENNSNSEDKGDFKIHSNIKSIFRTVLEKRASANKDDQNERSLEIRCMILKGTDISELEDLQNKLIELKKEKKIEYLYFNDVELTIKFGNLLDVQSLIECTKDIDVVVHLAGLVTDWAPKKLFFKIILEGTKNLLNACSENHVSRFIYMSSLTVHELNGHHYDNEEAPRDMKFYPYGVAKKMAEDEVIKWAESGEKEDGDKDDNEKRNYAIIRPGFIIYGARDKGSFILALDAIINGKFGFINKGKALISYV